MKCNRCRKEEDNIKNFGQFNFCEECAEEVVYHREGSFKVREGTDIEFNPKDTMGQAYYDISTGNIVLSSSLDTDSSITHEVIHKALHDIIGIEACYQYDNIYTYVETHFDLVF